mmetsp:Transcript_28214/g.36476  ORF Transcript_28214/g.36476 Transcript_28214/m.36476 type:complete len:139 (+) Transcript_28214:1-417(+)
MIVASLVFVSMRWFSAAYALHTTNYMLGVFILSVGGSLILKPMLKFGQANDFMVKEAQNIQWTLRRKRIYFSGIVIGYGGSAYFWYSNVWGHSFFYSLGRIAQNLMLVSFLKYFDRQGIVFGKAFRRVAPTTNVSRSV